jgi:hypothetical protein
LSFLELPERERLQKKERERNMIGCLWSATLVPSSPRYADWKAILGSDSVPLLAPQCSKAQLGDEETEVFLLDWQNLDGEQSDRLVNFISEKFGTAQAEVWEQLDHDNYFPIRAADVSVSYSMRAFL